MWRDVATRDTIPCHMNLFLFLSEHKERIDRRDDKGLVR
jgi:hypothetical protein